MIGTLSGEIAEAILEALPVEITVLDERDRIIAWNTSRPRLFGRGGDVLGRDVRACHSAKGLDMLERMLREMKSGERESVRLWYDHSVNGRPQKILIDYLALRDGEGRYLGCVEALQNLEPLRALEGERKTLDG